MKKIEIKASNAGIAAATAAVRTVSNRQHRWSHKLNGECSPHENTR